MEDQAKLTADDILGTLHEMAESRIPLERERWLNMAETLESFRYDEAKRLNLMEQGLAKKKIEIYNSQEKKSIALTELMVEATDEHRICEDQKAILHSIDQYVQIAKKSSDTF
jgi:hypothetical protein